MRYTVAGRIAAAIVACAGWIGLTRYLVAETATQGGSFPAALWINAGFLTDLTNFGVAIVMSGIALGSRRLSDPRVTGWATVAILTVGIGFWLIGGRLVIGKSALEDIRLHGVTPWAGLLVWLVFAPKGTLRWQILLPWLAWPVGYWTYALIRGTVSGSYAYGFLDLNKHSIGSVAIMLTCLIGLYVVLALGIIGTDRLTARRRA